MVANSVTAVDCLDSRPLIFNRTSRSTSVWSCYRAELTLFAAILNFKLASFWATVTSNGSPYPTGPLSCLSVSDVGVLWPNGSMDQEPLGTEVGLGPGDIMLDGDPAPPRKGAQQPPTFRPMSIAAKRSPISATAELLLPFIAINRRVSINYLTKICWMTPSVVRSLD